MISEPVLLLDREKCMGNIKFMAEKAAKAGPDFRPHFKTHRSAEIGSWFRNFGVTKIAVSSTDMAAYFAANGWDDITTTIPLNIRNLEKVDKIAAGINLNIDIVNQEAIDAAGKGLRNGTGVFIEIDTGHHRTGIDAGDFAGIEKLLTKIDRYTNLTFKGFLTHSGHTYSAHGFDEVALIHRQALEKLSRLKEYFTGRLGYFVISTGDTPSCSLMDDFGPVNELRPGNFVFYDVMQYYIGACSAGDIAVALASPVLAVHPERNEILIEGGAVHLSKDFATDRNGQKVFGLPVPVLDNGWGEPYRDSYLKSVSQEHGVISAGSEMINNVKPGELIGILPAHSCLAANLMKGYLTNNGKIDAL